MLTLSRMPLEEQKRKITKLMPVINELSVTTYFSMLRTKTNLVRGDFG